MLKITTASTPKSLTDFPRRNSFWLSALWALTAILFLPACEEEFGDTGIDVLPPGDLVGITYTDTSTVWLTSFQIDSQNTRNSSRQMFGNYIDPEFGAISAATYMQLMPGENLTFGPKQHLLLDSVVLFLDVDGVYGRAATPQNLIINEVTEAIPDTLDAPSNREIAFKTENMARGLTISNVPATGTLLRVRMKDEIGSRILFADDAILGDEDQFLNLVRGFRVSTEKVTYLTREPGAIFRLFARNETSGGQGFASLTSLRIYYRAKTDTSAYVAKTVTLSVNTGNKYTFLERETLDQRSLLGVHLAQPDQDSVYEFIQSGALIKGQIEFPNLSALQRVALLRAELFLPVAQEFLGSNNRYAPPNEILLVELDANKNEVLTTDGNLQLIHSSQIVYSSTAKGYVADITAYVQDIVAGRQTNFGVRLYPGARNISVNRAVLCGTSHPSRRPELRLTYTSLPR